MNLLNLDSDVANMANVGLGAEKEKVGVTQIKFVTVIKIVI